MFACKDAAGIWDDEKKKKQNVIRLQVVKYKYSVKKCAHTSTYNCSARDSRFKMSLAQRQISLAYSLKSDSGAFLTYCRPRYDIKKQAYCFLPEHTTTSTLMVGYCIREANILNFPYSYTVKDRQQA